MKKFLTLFVVCGFLLNACAAAPAALTGTWKLTAYGSAANPQPSVPNAAITFGADGKVSGNLGCNSFGGEYTATNTQINFGALMSTMMACVDTARMTQESVAFSILSQTTTYTLVGNTLTITGANGQVLVLEK